jgi:hypothetical protein
VVFEVQWGSIMGHKLRLQQTYFCSQGGLSNVLLHANVYQNKKKDGRTKKSQLTAFYLTSSEAHEASVPEPVEVFHRVKQNSSDISIYCGLNSVSKFYTD